VNWLSIRKEDKRMGTRFHFIGGIGIALVALAGIVSALGGIIGLENVVKQEEDQVSVVIKDEVRIHAGPDKDDPVKAMLQKGEQVRVIGREGAWVRVIGEDEDELGWVRGNTVVKKDSENQQEQGAS
jgi:uncharacterized protein YgiM (DUF1202 family)